MWKPNHGRCGLGASAAQAADWPRLAQARGCLERDLALREAPGEPAGRGLSHLVNHIGAHAGPLTSWERGDAARGGPAALAARLGGSPSSTFNPCP